MNLKFLFIFKKNLEIRSEEEEDLGQLLNENRAHTRLWRVGFSRESDTQAKSTYDRRRENDEALIYRANIYI